MWCPSSTSARTPRTATAVESDQVSKIVMRGLDPRIHISFRKGWIDVSSPAMTDRAQTDFNLNLDLRPELDDLAGWHAEERGGAFGIALQEREHGFPPHPHARDIIAGDYGLAANVIGDIGEIDAGQLALLAGELQSFENRWLLHEAIVQDHAGNTLDHLDNLRPIFVGNARGFLDQDGHEPDVLVQNVVVLDEFRQCKRDALRGRRQKHRGTRQSGAASVDGGLDQ